MSRFKTLQEMFKRYRRPGDFFFAMLFLLFGMFLLVNIPDQTVYVKRTKMFAQPAFWPILSIGLMTAFAALHAISSFVSPRLEGRWQEVTFWLRSLEYVIWFMAYVAIVPLAGYLFSTILFTVAITYRLGYRGRQAWVAATGSAVVIVVLFKSFLQVKVPGGEVYELLPTALRSFMLTYF
jgi:hypothetical protein